MLAMCCIYVTFICCIVYATYADGKVRLICDIGPRLNSEGTLKYINGRSKNMAALLKYVKSTRK